MMLSRCESSRSEVMAFKAGALVGVLCALAIPGNAFYLPGVAPVDYAKVRAGNFEGAL